MSAPVHVLTNTSRENPDLQDLKITTCRSAFRCQFLPIEQRDPFRYVWSRALLARTFGAGCLRRARLDRPWSWTKTATNIDMLCPLGCIGIDQQYVIDMHKGIIPSPGLWCTKLIHSSHSQTLGRSCEGMMLVGLSSCNFATI